MSTRLAVIISTLGLLVACSSASPPVHRYLLPLPVPEGTARLESPKRTGIASLTVAPYLRASGIVVESEGHQVRSARYHRWAESLSSGLRRFLQAEISQAVGYDISADATQASLWQEQISIEIERFHGTLDGEAELTARWEIEATGKAPVAYRFSETRPLAEGGYAGLVDAEIELARTFARAIAQTLQAGPAR